MNFKRLLLPVVLAIGTLFTGIEKTAAQQVNTYTFAQSSGTYTPLVNPTVLAVTTATNKLGNYVDSVAALPFTFNYGGIAFNKCYMSSRGYLFFGTSRFGASSTTPLSSNYATTQGIIAAWGNDIDAAYNVVGAGSVTYNGSMSWATLGTAPNRKIVFQWKNFNPVFSTSSATSYLLDFQIALEETTNKVSVSYGGLLGFTGSGLNISGGTQVGLRGLTSSDYQTRYNGNFTLFTNSANGGSSSATQSFQTTGTTPGMPTSGLTYIWTPTSNTLICFAPTAITASAITNTSATISWTAPTLAAASGGYQYEVRSTGSGGSGATGLAASGTTAAGITTTAVTGLAANTIYKAYVRSNCGGTNFSSWNLSPNFRTDCNVYMAPFMEGFGDTMVPTCWTNGNSTNSTDPNLLWKPGYGYNYGTANNGRPYGTFINIEAAYPYNAVVMLTSPVINLSGLTTPYLQFDWFKDNSNSATYLNNPLKLEGYNGTSWIPIFNDTSNSNMWRTVGIPLPASLTGITNAQFRFSVNKAIASNYFDYILVDSFSVANAPACFAPGNIRAANVAVTTATLNWGAAAAAPASGYQYEVRSAGAPGSGSVGLVASGNTASAVLTASITGLATATNYIAYVRSDCGTTSGTSIWKISLPFKTFCPAVTAPYSEGFNVGVLPDCWMNSNATGSTASTLYWKFGYGFDYGTSSNGRPAGSFAFVSAAPPFNSTVRLTSPIINLSGLITPFIKFDWFKRNTSTNTFGFVNNNLELEGYNGTAWVSLFNDTTNSTVWRTRAFALPASFTGITNAQFRFNVNKAPAQNYRDDVLLDSFSVTTAPICLEPTFLAFSYATNNGSISWGAPSPAPAGGYKYEVRTSGSVGSGATGLLASGSTAPGVTFASISGINVLTTYTVYVRSDCGTNSVLSSWKSKTFTTGCFYLSIPVSEGFNTGALPSCWTNTNTGGSSSANLFWKFDAGFDHGTLTNGRPAGSFAFVDADAPQTDTVTLTSPEISFAGIASPFVSFDWFKNNADPSATRTNNNLQLEGYNGNTWITLFNDTSNFNRWRTVDIPLAPAFTGVGNAKFRFRVNKALSGSNFDDVLLDNFFAGTIPICSKPTNVTVSAVTPTQATVNWTQAGVGNPTTWQISYGPSGVIAAAGTKMIVTTGSAIIQGLVQGTGYDVYVRALCNAANNNISAWSSVVSFTATPVGINNISLNGELTLFPNPASEFVTITNTSSQDMKHITVLNVIGAVVRETAATNGKEQRVNINGLAAGSYLVRIQLNGTTVVRRLQITK